MSAWKTKKGEDDNEMAHGDVDYQNGSRWNVLSIMSVDEPWY